jgi:hypothetical protein
MPPAGYGATTIWSSSTVPATTSYPDNTASELGLKFRSDISGYVTALRFYKGSGNTGTHVGHLWTSAGTLLASATFNNETASGWQQVTLAVPVAVSAGTTYVVSYFAPNGHYSVTRPYFTTSFYHPPLRALADGDAGPNGVYFSGKSGFPNATVSATNYWVDVVFLAASLWSNWTVPGTVSVPDSRPFELGVKFRSDISGYITGLRFYKGASNTGTHVGHLWTSTGTQLASVTFSNETGSGWQEATLATPVAVNAGSTYVASYYDPHGNYALSAFYFNSDHDSSPLHALTSGADGPDGVYNSGSSSFPTSSSNQNNYWVDIVFSPTASISASSSSSGSSPASSSGSAISVSGVAPSSASSAGGIIVKVAGSNFVNGASVSFGNANSTAAVFASPTQINALAPAHSAGTVNVTITNPDGSSATLPGGFTYTSGSTSAGSTTTGAGSSSGSTGTTAISGSVLFQDGFESGSFSGWGTSCSLYSSNRPFINSDRAFVHSGNYSYGQHYQIWADPNGNNRDDNRACWLPVPNLTHFFIRGYVYVGPVASGSVTNNLQRKFYYLKQEGLIYPWTLILGSFSNPDGSMALSLSSVPPRDPEFIESIDSRLSWGIANLQLNEWYELELEMKANTPGLRDGYVNVWVNGMLLLSRTGMNIRGLQSTGINVAGIGEQVNTTATGFVDEYRYWDDIAIASGYIAP